MKWISHRGNTSGPQPADENRLDYIVNALYDGYDVEVDVWNVNGTLYLGHDEPIEPLPTRLLYEHRLWFHCKNIEALQYFVQFYTAWSKQGIDLLQTPKYFWHDVDDYTLTSHNHIWVYPGKKLMPGSIAVLPERGYDGNLSECFAICTDDIIRFEKEVTNA